LSEILEFFKFLNCSYTRKGIVKSINVRSTAPREVPIQRNRRIFISES